jgi:hypothetical protein
MRFRRLALELAPQPLGIQAASVALVEAATAATTRPMAKSLHFMSRNSLYPLLAFFVSMCDIALYDLSVVSWPTGRGILEKKSAYALRVESSA